MRQKRIRGVALLVGLSITLCVSGCAEVRFNAAAACSMPVVELREESLYPGGVVGLKADFIWETCEDTGGASRAASDVTVTITPSTTGEEVVLARPIPEGDRSTVSGFFDLPADLALGPAVLAVRTHTGDQIDAELPIEITTPSA